MKVVKEKEVGMESLKQIRRFRYFSAIGGSTSGGMRVDQHKRYSHIGVIDEIGDLVEERKFYFQDKDKAVSRKVGMKR